MYNYPPPMWPGYPPPNNDHLERGIRLAIKMAQREEREKERKKLGEKKERDEYRKRAYDGRRSFLVALELYIFGVISYPFVMPMYTALLAAVQK